jgi:hypothetical protein
VDCIQIVLKAFGDSHQPLAALFAFVRLEGVWINLLTPSGFFTYRQGLTLKNSTWRSLCVECFVRISEQTATFALYNINWLVFITVEVFTARYGLIPYIQQITFRF